MQIPKVLEITDLGVSLVSLQNGVYQIDNETVVISGYGDKEPIQVKNHNDIRSIDVVKIPDRYISDKQQEISAQEYQQQKDKLYSDYDQDKEIWKGGIDSEYEYIKFKQRYTVVYKRITTVGEPLPVELRKSVIDTGSEFISPLWRTDILAKDSYLFKFNRMGCEVRQFRELVKEYSLKHELKAHSHLRFATVEGEYCFDESFSKACPFIGTLEACLALEKSTKEIIKKKVLSCAAVARKIVSAEDLDLKELLSLVSKLQTNLSAIDPKQKSYQSKRYAGENLKEIKDYLEAVSAKVMEENK